MVHAGDDINVGEIIADKYRVERVLGRGGMGTVVAVWHQDLHERRAIKFMLPKAAQIAEAVERFLREARAAARLKSPHAVKIHDVSRLPSGVPYIVMEYLEGMDLDKLLETRGPLSVEEACGYILQACDAIGEAHALGIVHRDLKPANLFITTGVRGEPFVKVLDFGIAKVARNMDVKSPSITVAHRTMGTPAYMSPEHVSDSKSVDGRADIWSLGVMLYQLTTCALPFVAHHHPVLYAKILDDREVAPPPSRVHSALSPEFDAVVLRCLDKNIYTRYQSIAELVAALTPFVTVTGAGAPKRQPSSAGHLGGGPMGTIPLDHPPRPPLPSAEHTVLPTVASGPPLAIAGPTLQGGMVRTTQPPTSMRNAIVASAVAGSLITGLAVWIMVAGGRHDEASGTVAAPAITGASMPFQDKPISQTPAPVTSVASVAPETTPVASDSSAPKLAAPSPQPAPKSTGQKKQSSTTKTATNKEFSTRK